MKLQTDGDSKVEIGGAKELPKQFMIASSKEAFKILSSGLYNDKILAIIRELCCNAYDSHVAAGKADVPFDLHLPTPFEPYFSIKDYGVGLSNDEIMELYCTYFASNKSDSNLFVGALGLGSKSPFCYTEGFTVNSRYNGKTRIYSAFIGEDGTPNVVLQTEEDTPGVANGLEIQFPVKVDDCWEFENKAGIALEFFNPLPNINIPDLKIEQQKYSFKTDSWGLRAGYSHHSTQVRAIQGMVQYSIGNIDKSKLTPLQAKLVNMPLDLFFPIGELSVAASRETLSNDDRTIEHILQHLDQVGATYLDEFKKKLAQCESWWEARIMIHNLSVAGDALSALINDAYERGDFDGNYGKYVLTRNEPVINELDYPNLLITYYGKRHTSPTPKKERSFKTYEERKEAEARIAKDGKTGYYYTQYKYGFEVNDKTLFVIDDVGIGVDRYINAMFRDYDNKFRSVYMFGKAHKDVLQQVVTAEAKLLMKDILGNPPVMLASEIKEKYNTKVTPTEAVKYVPKPIVVFHPAGNINRYVYGDDGTHEQKGWRKAWARAEVIPTGPKYYVVVSNGVPVDLVGKIDFAEYFRDWYQDLVICQLFGMTSITPIYGVTKESLIFKNPQSNPDWIDLVKYIQQTLPVNMTPDKEMELSLQILPFEARLKASTLSKLKKDPSIKNTEFGLLIKSYLDATKLTKKPELQALTRIVNKAKAWGWYTIKNIADFEAEWEKIYAKFPLMQMIEGRYLSPEQEDLVLKYVKDTIRLDELEQQAITSATFAQQLPEIELQEEPLGAN